MGAMDWAGFDHVCALLGVTDPDQLIERLLVIKLHRPNRGAASERKTPEQLMEDL